MIKTDRSMQCLSINIKEKFKILQTFLLHNAPVAVAFSGGVDSSLLLAAAADIAPAGTYAITCFTPLHRKEEIAHTVRLAESRSIPHTVLECDPLSEPLIAANQPDRCYHCKKFLYTKMNDWATANGKPTLLDGNHSDDLTHYRPGLQALKELGVTSPLAAAGLKKEEIRALAKVLDLPNWQAPSRPCLATRIPYGTTLDGSVLAKLGQGEADLLSLGFSDCRLRLHGDILRLELPQEDMGRLMPLKERILDLLKPLGFPYITLDMAGLTSGSMDQKLNLTNGRFL